MQYLFLLTRLSSSSCWKYLLCYISFNIFPLSSSSHSLDFLVMYLMLRTVETLWPSVRILPTTLLEYLFTSLYLMIHAAKDCCLAVLESFQALGYFMQLVCLWCQNFDNFASLYANWYYQMVIYYEDATTLYYIHCYLINSLFVYQYLYSFWISI